MVQFIQRMKDGIKDRTELLDDNSKNKSREAFHAALVRNKNALKQIENNLDNYIEAAEEVLAENKNILSDTSAIHLQTCDRLLGLNQEMSSYIKELKTIFKRRLETIESDKVSVNQRAIDGNKNLFRRFHTDTAVYIESIDKVLKQEKKLLLSLQ